MRRANTSSREGAVNHLAGHIVLNKTMFLAPGQHGTDTITLFAGNFRFAGPYRCQYAQHVFPSYLIDSDFSNQWQDMFFHALFPILGSYLTAPARTGQTYLRVSNQTDIMTFTMYCESLYPGFCACAGNFQI